MKIPFPVAYIDRKQPKVVRIGGSVFEVPEVGDDEARVVIEHADGPHTVRYRQYDGRLWRPAKFADGRNRLADLVRFDGSRPIGHQALSRLNPDAILQHPLGPWGALSLWHGTAAKVPDADNDAELMLASEAFMRTRHLVEHALIIDGVVHCETIGPVLVLEGILGGKPRLTWTSRDWATRGHRNFHALFRADHAAEGVEMAAAFLAQELEVRGEAPAIHDPTVLTWDGWPAAIEAAAFSALSSIRRVDLGDCAHDVVRPVVELRRALCRRYPDAFGKGWELEHLWPHMPMDFDIPSADELVPLIRNMVPVRRALIGTTQKDVEFFIHRAGHRRLDPCQEHGENDDIELLAGLDLVPTR